MATSRRDYAVRRLRAAARTQLNGRERNELAAIIRRYWTTNSLPDLTDSLWALLDTDDKKQSLVPLLQAVLPAAHRKEFGRRLLADDMRQIENGAVAAKSISADNDLVPTGPTRRRQHVLPPKDFDSGRAGIPRSEVRLLTLDKRSRDRLGGPLGMGLRGGAEHGLGIYVSSVDEGSPAADAGLRSGDLILSVNGVSFNAVTNSEAVKIIRNATSTLEMEVWYAGRVPGSYETHQEYWWIDVDGQPTSPPSEIEQSERYVSSGKNRSELMLLKDVDERKVNVTIGGSRKLGITIRGGNEYGLGVYISQVEAHSAAERAGLKIGDQILDVNGYSFLDISHSEAVACLRSAKRLIMTVKDVGKVPHAMTSYDQTQWIANPDLEIASAAIQHQQNGDPQGRSPSASTLSRLGDRPDGSLFTRGVGSQLMLRSSAGQTAQLSIVVERVRRLLPDEKDAACVSHYVTEYVSGHVTVEALVFALYQLLNTKRKKSLLNDIRGLILPRDIVSYDKLINDRNTSLTRRFGSMDSLFRLPDTLAEHSLSTVTSLDLSQSRTVSESDNDGLSTLRKVIDELTTTVSRDSDTSSLQQTVSKTNGRAARKTKKRQPNGTVENSHQFAESSQTKNDHWSLNNGATTGHINVTGGQYRVDGYTNYSPTGERGRQVLNDPGPGAMYADRAGGGRNSWHDVELRPYFTSVHLATVDRSTSTRRPPSAVEDTPIAATTTVSTQTDGMAADHHKPNGRSDLLMDWPQRWRQQQLLSTAVNASSQMQRLSVYNDNNIDAVKMKKSLTAMRSSSFDESLPETSTVTLNHQLDGSDVATPSDKRSIDSDVDGASQSPLDGPTKSVATSGALYAVPTKPPRPSAVGVSAKVDRTPNGGDPGGSRSVLSHKPRRHDGGVVRPRGASAGSRPRLPPEYLAGHNGANSRDQANLSPDRPTVTNGVGALSVAAASGNGVKKSLTDTILPPPEVFSDSDDTTFADGVDKRSADTPGVRHHHHHDAVYSEVEDVTLTARSASADVGTSARPSAVVPDLKNDGPGADELAANGLKAVEERTDPNKRILLRINKTQPILGIAIEGGANTRIPLPRVAKIQPNGSASGSDLRVGQSILQVDGKSLVGLRHIDCARAIAESFRNRAKSHIDLVVTENDNDGFEV